MIMPIIGMGIGIAMMIGSAYVIITTLVSL